jgi:hypothetical protein
MRKKYSWETGKMHEELLCLIATRRRAYRPHYPMQKLHQGMSNLQYRRATSGMRPSPFSMKVI